MSRLTRQNLPLNVGQTLEVPLVFNAHRDPDGHCRRSRRTRPTVDTRRAEAATALDAAAVAGCPTTAATSSNLTTLTPNVAITQGPDGDVLSVGGQRGIHNNVSVDGADFNNPFFGEQRGGQRPAFTFNLDAVREMVVMSQGANAEFGRSGGGFVNVITKSGTNDVHGTLHYFGKDGGVSSDGDARALRTPQSGLSPAPVRVHARRPDQAGQAVLLHRVRSAGLQRDEADDSAEQRRELTQLTTFLGNAVRRRPRQRLQPDPSAPTTRTSPW